MQSRLLALLSLALLFASPARADRALSEAEQTQLQSALSAQGCSGSKIELDGGHYEVENARCSDGKTYELKFDAKFQLLKKELED